MNAVSPDGSRVTLEVSGGATWSPDGQRFACVGALGSELRLTDSSGKIKVVLETDGSKERLLDRPMWSPDGRSVAVVVVAVTSQGPYTNSLAVIDVDRRKITGRYSIPTDVIHLPRHFTAPDKFRWSPDGRKVLISWESAAVIHVDTGRVETISGAPVVAEWAPDGGGVYYFEIAGPLPRRELGGFYLKRLGQPPVMLVGARPLATSGFKVNTVGMSGVMALSPTGRWLALSLGSDEPTGSLLRFYDLKPGEPPALESPEKVVPTVEAIAALEWAPDERSVAMVSLLFRDARMEEPPIVRIRLFDMVSDQWQTLASWRLEDPMEIEVLTSKVLGWTQ